LPSGKELAYCGQEKVVVLKNHPNRSISLTTVISKNDIFFSVFSCLSVRLQSILSQKDTKTEKTETEMNLNSKRLTTVKT